MKTFILLHPIGAGGISASIHQKRLTDYDMIRRISRKGSCPDRAATENLFGLLESRLLYIQEFISMEYFRRGLVEYPFDCISGGSRQRERASRLRFTDNKPFGCGMILRIYLSDPWGQIA